ncbi:hypothetical protein A6C57_27690 (plasmid) [Fibrella sp. ES10-3-2-2]
MADCLHTVPSTVQTANEVLAHQITQSLMANEFIEASEEADVLTLLIVGNAKAGDWLQLLQKNLLLNSTLTEKGHAATNHSA